jgi:hypothetical protein
MGQLSSEPQHGRIALHLHCVVGRVRVVGPAWPKGSHCQALAAHLLSLTYYSFISVTTASSTWLQEEGDMDLDRSRSGCFYVLYIALSTIWSRPPDIEDRGAYGREQARNWSRINDNMFEQDMSSLWLL